MSILSKIFSSGATELVKEVGGVVDNLTTSKEDQVYGLLKSKTVPSKKFVSEEITTLGLSIIY